MLLIKSILSSCLFVCFLRVRQSGGGLLNSSQTQMTGQLTPEAGESKLTNFSLVWLNFHYAYLRGHLEYNL